MSRLKQCKRHGEQAARALLVTIMVSVVLTTAAPAWAQAVAVRVVDLAADFTSSTVVTVEVVVENVRGVAGLDFSIDYPSTLIATENLTTHANGGLWGLVVVNHDDQSGENPPAEGFRRISVAAADATGREVDEGLLITLDFEVACGGFAQDFPAGRDVILDVHRVNAFDENVERVEAVGIDGTLSLDCTTVDVQRGASFGTLKVLYDATTRED